MPVMVSGGGGLIISLLDRFGNSLVFSCYREQTKHDQKVQALT